MKIKWSVKKGFSFGLASGIITTMGLMTGLNSSTGSRVVVLSGIILIAIADALSDAFGIHISEEADSRHTHEEVWEATIATFFSKFFFAMTFVIPVLLFELSTAIIVNIIWGLLLIAIYSYYIAKFENKNKFPVIIEHVTMAISVIIITHYVGHLVAAFV